MYDATSATALSIPRNALLVAGYVDGAVITPWSDQLWAEWPNARKVRISTWGPRNLGNCLDIEDGDSIPEDAPAWVDNAKARGIDLPILYCGLSAFPRVRSLVGNREVLYWIAHYTQIPHLPAGADACQYADEPSVTGGNFDLSICTPRFYESLKA